MYGASPWQSQNAVCSCPDGSLGSMLGVFRSTDAQGSTGQQKQRVTCLCLYTCVQGDSIHLAILSGQVPWPRNQAHYPAALHTLVSRCAVLCMLCCAVFFCTVLCCACCAMMCMLNAVCQEDHLCCHVWPVLHAVRRCLVADPAQRPAASELAAEACTLLASCPPLPDPAPKQ